MNVKTPSALQLDQAVPKKPGCQARRVQASGSEYAVVRWFFGGVKRPSAEAVGEVLGSAPYGIRETASLISCSSFGTRMSGTLC